MSINNYDVIIVGSGPAGSSSAYFLASKGIKVLVIEKESLPRYKTCGGGIVQRTTELLPFSIESISEVECFSSEIYDMKNKRHFITNRNKPIVYMTMRRDFDSFVLQKASKAGAVIKDNLKVIDIIINKNNIEVITDKENYAAYFVIGADGANGICSKKSNIKISVKKMPALEYEIYIDDSTYKKFNKSARFDFDIIPHGYGWVFPKKDHLSVGVVEMKKGRRELNKLFEAYLKLLNINNIQNYERHGYYIPLIKNGNRKFAGQRIFLTGDAAGFADPVTAEGISHAIHSGKLAAESILESGLDANLAADLYNYKVNHTIIDEYRFSKIIASLVYVHPFIRGLLFRFYGQRLSELITDIFMGEKKYRELLTDPINYFKLLKYLFN